MHPARTARGYCGIGAEGVSKSANVGALLRTAHAFGAAFCFTIGAGWDARAGRRSDTADTPAHVPLWRFADPAALQLPRECVLVGVELLERCGRSALVPASAERGLRAGARAVRPVGRRCWRGAGMWCGSRPGSRSTWPWPGRWCLYDRMLQHGRFAERPVGKRRAARTRRIPCRTWRPAVPADDPGLAARPRNSRFGRVRLRPAGARLPQAGPHRISPPCRSLPLACLRRCSWFAAGSATAQTRPGHAPPRAHRPAPAEGPRRIGKWDDWQAATHQEAGQPVCYAFTRPTGSNPALPGRGDVVLTVTERPGGRDAVALTRRVRATARMPRSSWRRKASPCPSTRPAARPSRGTAARRWLLFGRARQAIAHSPGPRGTAVTDTFSLRGFSQAYAAINKACPAR